MKQAANKHELVEIPLPRHASRRYRVWWAVIILAFSLLGWKVQRAVSATLSATPRSSAKGSVHWGAARLRHAKRFTVEYREDSKVVRVIDPDGQASVAQYQLVERGCAALPIDDKTTVIEIPVRRVVALSTAFVSAFTRLGATDRLVGMAGVKLLNTPGLIERARRGDLVEVGDGKPSMGLGLDLERIRMLSPDLIMSSYLGGSGGKLREAGLNVVENAEWLEETPLGRAEWIKFMAAFLNLETEAEQWFSALEKRYEDVASRTRDLSTRPAVLCGIDDRGTWLVPGGQSYLAKFIDDAGGDYMWRFEKHTGNLPLKMEAVLARAQHAEIWLLQTSSVRSKREIAELDTRHVLFDAFNSGRIYSSDAVSSPGGGNDYWENGVANPDLVLADLIAIIHPELAAGHAPHWYRKLPEGPAL